MRPIVQIYEIQTPQEVQSMVSLGVDHVGSVITSADERHDPLLRETVALVRRSGVTSSLIPLYSDTAVVMDTLAFMRPDIVHFCERLDPAGNMEELAAAIRLQATVRQRFPDIRIMRSIPIGEREIDGGKTVLAMARQLEASCDFFLTDTVIGDPRQRTDADQPVSGFVGITGRTCDWSVAARLVSASRIPVILAGGITPENVAEGIRRVRPAGVDSCTGTNAVDAAGNPVRFRKDPQRVATLIAEARRAAEPLAAPVRRPQQPF